MRKLLADAGLSVRDILRTKEQLYAQLRLADPGWSDDQLLDLIGQHPILTNRPRCEAVLEILPVA